MKIVLAATYFIYIWLYCKGRKIVCTGSSQTGIVGICYKMSLYLLSKPFFQNVMQEKLMTRLSVLYPVYERKNLVRHYCAQKLSTVLMILFAGVHLLFFMEISEQRNSILRGGYQLVRGDYGQEAETVGLKVEGEDVKVQLSYPLPARKYTAEEMERQMDAFEAGIAGLIAGQNTSLEQVIYPLDLHSTYEDCGFSVAWGSSDYSLLDDDGSVYNDTLSDPAPVLLTAELTYDDLLREITLPIRICPREKTEEEKAGDRVLLAIQKADEDEKADAVLKLPETIGDTPVTYALSEETPYPLYLAGLAVVAVIVFFARDRDLEKKMKEREKDLLLRYPEFVSQFVLLTGAGMSVRGVLEKLSGESSMGVYLGQELRLLVRDLGNGILEAQALDTFGKRCGLGPYIKLSGLLIQNMKKGNRELFSQLREEAADAFAKRKNEARKLGEEAGTKLLLPMMGMLLVVMIVIIVPAFLSFRL